MTDAPEDQPELLPAVASATDTGEHKKRENAAKREAREEREFWQRVMADKIGRRVIFKLLQKTNVFKTEFAASSYGVPHPDAQNYLNGQRDLGLWLYHELGLNAREGLFAMLDEHDSRYVEFAKRERR